MTMNVWVSLIQAQLILEESAVKYVEGKLGFAVKGYQAACERYCGVDSKEEVGISLPIGYDNV